ncbi:ATP-dependent RNA helicase DDX42, putative [Plasmodium ovale]|uniref:RNA helicase n=2 Tax=Plasmodium ovale TaxID=36330 RepID=A0A1A8W760_PLAOA|nr:ATP-dependent RNA helicase, putative [Plasmodium ovale curtisi]SCP04175.1 ATP-dependent RNA helicase DDX42, putative [Plasmodium ovale]
MSDDFDEENFFEEDDNFDSKGEGHTKGECQGDGKEVDPLDEFMVEINKVIEEEKKKKEATEVRERQSNRGSEDGCSKRTLSRSKYPVAINTPPLSNNKDAKNEKEEEEENSLDDNDVTADIYAFLEKKNEELMNERLAEGERNRLGRQTKWVSSDTCGKNSEDDEYGQDDFLRLQDEKDDGNEDDVITCNVRHEEIQLDYFNKNIFHTDESISTFTLEESVEYKKKHNITTIGFNVPKPIFSFLQLKGIIHKDVLENMYNISISILSPVQSIVIPIFLSGRDFIANSRTGSGKTLSYIISLIIHVMSYKNAKKGGYITFGDEVEKETMRDASEDVSPKGAHPSEVVSPKAAHATIPSAHALVLTPTRELCVQIQDEMNRISLGKVKSCILFSGINYKKAYDDIHRGVDTIIANVKTLINFVNKKYLSLMNIKYVVLDEFDKLFSKQFFHSVVSILNNIRSDSIKGFFSSTFSEHICELAKPYMSKKSIIIKVGDMNVYIDKKFYILEETKKYAFLLKCIEKCVPLGLGFIFCNSKKNVMVLHEKLKREISQKHIVFDFIHGDIDQTERIHKLECLKKKNTQILISTDLMSRGIDVIDLNFVINYDCPNDIFLYIHRIGRCSRMNNKGQAITFITPGEKKIAFLIYSHLKKKKETVDEELENFIRRNNLHNDVMLNRMKRKMESAFFDMPSKKTENSRTNILNPNEISFKKVQSTQKKEESVLKRVHMITPNDVLTSSDEEY